MYNKRSQAVPDTDDVNQQTETKDEEHILFF